MRTASTIASSRRHPSAAIRSALWFDASSGLLARIVQRDAQDTSTTVLDDYRDVGGVRMPFRMIADRTDAAGRTDPRARTDIQLAEVKLNVAVADADFAMPEMAATARIDDASGITRIPFDLVNNHIYADGTIDGKKARFLVDTGGSNVLTPAAAKKFGIEGEGEPAGARRRRRSGRRRSSRTSAKSRSAARRSPNPCS